MSALILPHTPYLPTPELDEWTDAAARIDRMCAPLPDAPVQLSKIGPLPKPHTAQGLILAYLRANPGKNQRQIIAALGVPRTTVGTTVTRLADRGLITIVAHWHNSQYFPVEIDA